VTNEVATQGTNEVLNLMPVLTMLIRVRLSNNSLNKCRIIMVVYYCQLC